MHWRNRSVPAPEDAFRKNLPENETFHFLPKPFSLKQLAVAVKETLGK